MESRSAVDGPWVEFTEVEPKTSSRPNPKFSRLTGVSIRLCRTKFDEEVDSEVRSAVARQKPRQISKNNNFDRKISPKIFFGIENLNFWNRPKRVLAKFRADRSRPRRLQM